MANLCGYRIQNKFLYMALILCIAIAIVVGSSQQLMQPIFDRLLIAAAKPKELKKMVDNVYHSERVFRLNYAQMENKFKIYIYPLGKRCSAYEATTVGMKYASESFFVKNIRESTFFTDDPHQAHLFFIPISLQKLHQKESSYTKVGKKADQCVKSLIDEHPYWNTTLGADHFILTCVDRDVHIPILVKNTIRIVCSTAYDSDVSRFIPHKDFSLPSVMQQSAYTKPPAGKDMHKRERLGFWAGVCNSNTRKKLVELWGADEVLSIHDTSVNFYTAKFCICPAGSRISNSRIMLAIRHGCVPVIMDDYLDLPFNDILDWWKFSVILREHDVYRLKGLLRAVECYNYERMYSNLMEVRRHFEWNSPPVKYDAFHMVIYELWLRRHHVKYTTPHARPLFNRFGRIES